MKSFVFYLTFFLVVASFTFGQPTDYIAHWSFSGNALDESGNGYDCSVVGTSLTSDRFSNADNAYQFSGTQYMELTSSDTFNFNASDFSISLWFKTSSNSTMSFMAKQQTDIYRGWNLCMVSGQVCIIAGQNPYYGRINTSGFYNDGQWHHLVVNKVGLDANQWSMYIDGGLDFSVVNNGQTDPDISNSSSLYIGRRQGDSFHQGDLDDIRVYGRELVATEVTELFGDLVVVSSTSWSAVDDNMIYMNGNVGIGVDNPDVKLAVNGAVTVESIKVDPNSWPDYVFDESYNLTSLDEVEKFILENKHLSEIPSEKEVSNNGVDLGEMNVKLLQKIEELTLYLIEEHKDKEQLKNEIEVLKEEISSLKQADVSTK